MHSGTVLLDQVCTDPSPMHCSIAQGKMLFLLVFAAVQSRLTAECCDRTYIYGHALFIQVCREPTPMHCSFV